MSESTDLLAQDDAADVCEGGVFAITSAAVAAVGVFNVGVFNVAPDTELADFGVFAGVDFGVAKVEDFGVAKVADLVAFDDAACIA